MTMTDDLVKRLRAIDHLSVEDCFCQSALYDQAADRVAALTADNARLRASLTGIKRAAAHRMKNDPKDLHSYYFHTADAALNTGKEPSHE
jgi:hypothetical protein